MPDLPYSAPLMAVLLLLGIAHVSFQLFADYTSRALDQLLIQGELKKRERVNLEQQKVRMFALVILAFEMALFLGSGQVRAEAPALTTVVFIAATLIQTWIQQRLEIKAQRALIESQPDAATQTAQQSKERAESLLRSLVSLSISVSLYGLTVLLTLRLTLTAARSAGLSATAQTLVAFAGCSLSLLLGLTVHFLTTRLFVRLLHPAKRLGQDSREWDLLKSSFAAARLPVPAAYVWTNSLTNPRTVLVTGIRQLWMTVAVFIAPQAIQELTPSQLFAVFAHEAAHLHHNHLLKRLGYLVANLIGTLLVTSTALIVLRPEAPLPLTLTLALCSWYVISRGMSRSKLFQEIEADRTAVLRLGAEPRALIEALAQLQDPREWGQDLRIRVQLLERLEQSQQTDLDQSKAA